MNNSGQISESDVHHWGRSREMEIIFPCMYTYIISGLLNDTLIYTYVKRHI